VLKFSSRETSLNNTSWWKDFSGIIGSTTRENWYFGLVVTVGTRGNRIGRTTPVLERIVDIFGTGTITWGTSL